MKIKAFKRHIHRAFHKYQASSMRKSKLHAFYHLHDPLRELGGIEYMNGGLFESTHKRFRT